MPSTGGCGGRAYRPDERVAFAKLLNTEEGRAAYEKQEPLNLSRPVMSPRLSSLLVMALRGEWPTNPERWRSLASGETRPAFVRTRRGHYRAFIETQTANAARSDLALRRKSLIACCAVWTEMKVSALV